MTCTDVSSVASVFSFIWFFFRLCFNAAGHNYMYIEVHHVRIETNINNSKYN